LSQVFRRAKIDGIKKKKPDQKCIFTNGDLLLTGLDFSCTQSQYIYIPTATDRLSFSSSLPPSRLDRPCYFRFRQLIVPPHSMLLLQIRLRVDSFCSMRTCPPTFSPSEQHATTQPILAELLGYTGRSSWAMQLYN
jgi:hypothetical protein